ncbi:hypothetical protein K1720_09745 [Thermococcus argininiproducens]|uniref:Uncharacterized protein n=1 Tax=Thermococcus argininiproducens TaxID=2866384 RepID=A0A9E7M9S4_9EURY|nr:hypothetical protein [Thermococcus argininiproducens]USG99758.1 hypothetical protein K1720_09745 [Thermococcus argininiproducens]
MRIKSIVSLFFFLMGAYFVGMALLSVEEKSVAIGFMAIALVHFLVLFGVLGSVEIVIQVGTYITLLDLIFGIIWILVSFEPASVSLTFLAAIVLVLITSEEFKNEIEFG